MKLKRNQAIIYALLGLACFIVVVKIAGVIKQPDPVVSTPTLEVREIIATGFSSDEQERIVSFVDTFERAVAERDSNKVLRLFSEPETDSEKSELDFILWRDVDPSGTQEGSRLFTTAGYNFTLTKHEVREVRKDGAQVKVFVDELRTFPSGDNSAHVSRMLVKLRETSHGYAVVRYYHQEPTANRDLKYEGFIAE